jgi:mannosyltransferase OCH1-like enzyme
MGNYDYLIYAIYIIFIYLIYIIINFNERISTSTSTNIKNNLIPVPHYIQKTDYSSGDEIFNVPLNIYHTWNSKNIPKNMKNNIDYILNYNPEFDYYLYDDNECRNYIMDNFSEDVLDAFDTLIPGAYKADLWRCCILYKKGGVYMDIKLKPLVKLKNLLEFNNFYFVKDTPTMEICDYKIGVYNAFLVSYPYNIIFKLCIEEIVNNCKMKFYGLNSLAITGPCLLGNIFNKYYKEDYDSFIELYLNKKDNSIYNKNNIKIIGVYDEYRSDQMKSGSLHYSLLWNQKNVFNLVKNKKMKKYV